MSGVSGDSSSATASGGANDPSYISGSGVGKGGFASFDSNAGSGGNGRVLITRL